jgi:hypothetical protein
MQQLRGMVEQVFKMYNHTSNIIIDTIIIAIRVTWEAGLFKGTLLSKEHNMHVRINRRTVFYM